MLILRTLLAGLLLGCLTVSSWAQEASSSSAPSSPRAQEAPEKAAPEGSQSTPEGDKDSPSFERPTGAVRLGGEEGFGIGGAVGDPSALNAPDRTAPVLDQTTRSSTFNVSGYYLLKPADNQQLLFEVNLDPTFLGSDLAYSWQPEGWEGAWTANFWLSTAHFAPFDQHDPRVRLPNGDDEPYLQQGGFGLEYAQEMTEDLDLAVALNYQNFAFSDALLGGNRFARDFTGTPLALGDRATGDLYTFALHGIYDTLDDRQLPNEGTKIRFGLEQAFGLGNTSTPYTRLSANVAHMIAVPGFNEGPHSLLLNLQAGTLLGQDAPNVRGFFLGGPNSVRGYQQGEMAGGTSFIQATAEYRHHLTSFSVMEKDIKLNAAAFVDYGTVMGTQRRLRGIPELLYDKPESGTSYGIGLHFGTDFGIFKLETAWSNQGNQTTYFSVGERF